MIWYNSISYNLIWYNFDMIQLILIYWGYHQEHLWPHSQYHSFLEPQLLPGINMVHHDDDGGDGGDDSDDDYDDDDDEDDEDDDLSRNVFKM